MGLLQQLEQQTKPKEKQPDVIVQNNISTDRIATTLSPSTDQTTVGGLLRTEDNVRQEIDSKACPRCGCTTLWLDIYSNPPHCLACDPPAADFLLARLIRVRTQAAQDEAYTSDSEWDEWDEGAGLDAVHVIHRRREAIRRNIGPDRRWTAAEWDLMFTKLWIETEQQNETTIELEL